MMNSSAIKSALVIATVGVLATPAIAGGKQAQPHLKPAPLASLVKKTAPLAKLDAAVKADADADAEQPAPEAKPVERYDLGFKKPALGEAYDVLKPGRRTALPGEAELVIVPRSLTQIQIGAVAKEKAAEIEYCWQQLAVIERMPSTAVLKLKIDVTGAVTKLAIGGDAPAVVNSCLADTVAHWTFPEAETKTEISYPIAFRSL